MFWSMIIHTKPPATTRLSIQNHQLQQDYLYKTTSYKKNMCCITGTKSTHKGYFADLEVAPLFSSYQQHFLTVILHGLAKLNVSLSTWKNISKMSCFHWQTWTLAGFSIMCVCVYLCAHILMCVWCKSYLFSFLWFELLVVVIVVFCLRCLNVR